MRRTRGLNTRLVVAIAVLATLHVAVFAVLLTTLHQLGASDHRARTAARIAMNATDSRIALARQDAAALRRSTVALASAGRAAGQPAAIALARTAHAYAAALPATGSRTRPETAAARALDRRLALLEHRERDARNAQRDHVTRLTRTAWIAGACGVAATLLCALGFLLYLRRALLAPLRGVAGAARRLAAGDLGARVGMRESGIGEVGELARTFDQMAASLEESRAVLERQNRELAQQRSELIEAVRSAREGASIVRAVLDTTPDAIALLDGDGAVIVDNPPMRAVRAAFAAQGTTLGPRASAGSGGENGASRAVAGGDDDGERRDEVALPGGRRTFARYVAPVHDGRGRLIGRLLVVRDITGEREAERAKQDFFALVSHELRTPLTAILGYVELVLSDDAAGLSPEHARHLEVIERNARRLVRIVGDLLFAAQVDGSPLLLEPGVVDLAALVHDAVELARPRAAQSGVALTTEIAAIDRCVGDRDRLAQVLDNLLSNALKFTPAGGRVVVRLLDDESCARIEVEDDGVGIPPEELPHLFDRFYRARNATSRSIPGLGLGLAIVRTVVEAHGGTVSVRSERGRGACFTILLPVGDSDSRSRAPSGADRRPTDPIQASGAGSPRTA